MGDIIYKYYNSLLIVQKDFKRDSNFLKILLF